MTQYGERTMHDLWPRMAVSLSRSSVCRPPYCESTHGPIRTLDASANLPCRGAIIVPIGLFVRLSSLMQTYWTNVVVKGFAWTTYSSVSVFLPSYTERVRLLDWTLRLRGCIWKNRGIIAAARQPIERADTQIPSMHHILIQGCRTPGIPKHGLTTCYRYTGSVS